MNEDRILGAGRNMPGRGERAVGEAAGSDRLAGDGVVDQVVGTIRHGFGKARDVVTEFANDVPRALGQVTDRGRHLARQDDDSLRRQLRYNGSMRSPLRSLWLRLVSLRPAVAGT